ncbi:hypothetical protein L1049_007980 [Liquidambar formosana]|uniref:UDP-glycosyltransferase n=1 Tax=Liquidambar formosana TaxID=63359 RepID=A0AAP0S8Z3_LIQFO
MTHCGWNSVMESVVAGVPMITWPLFAEQFYNENFVLNRLRIGVGIDVESGLEWGKEERVGALVKRHRVEEAVSRLMGEGEAVEGMRKRASELGEMARLAVSKGGSSDVSMGLLIEDLLNQKGVEIGYAGRLDPRRLVVGLFSLGSRLSGQWERTSHGSMQQNYLNIHLQNRIIRLFSLKGRFFNLYSDLGVVLNLIPRQ